MIARVLRALGKPVRVLSRNRHFRRATRRARLLPSCLIIGAQRAGTTSLYDYLCQHPDVAGPTAAKEEADWAKELHFFDDRFWRGVDWYRSFFPLSATRFIARRRNRDLVGLEATPSYLYHPAAPARVAATLPDIRLIALLREPIARAYSHYQLMRRQGRESLSFEDALAAEEERLAGEEERLLADPRHSSEKYRDYGYVARGLYADQLERWFTHFPRDQLLVLSSQDLFTRPAEVYTETLAFLGLRPWLQCDFVHRNLASYGPIDPALRARLEERFAEPNARLARLLNRDFGWKSAAVDDRGGAPALSSPPSWAS